MVETGETGPSIVQVAAISRDRDEHQLCGDVNLAKLLGDLIAVDARQPDIKKTTSGRSARDMVDHREIRRRYMKRDVRRAPGSWPWSGQCLYCRPRSGSADVGPGHRPNRGRAFSARDDGSASGQAHHELAPLARAGTEDGNRAIVKFDKSFAPASVRFRGRPGRDRGTGRPARKDRRFSAAFRA